MKKLALLLTLAISASIHAATSLKDTIAAYDGMTLGQATPFHGEITSGHMTFKFAEGNAAPVVAGNETIGFFFAGKGSYEYVSNDPVEAAVLKTNVKRATGLALAEKPGALTVSDTFEQLLLIRGKLPELSTSATISVDAPFQQFKQLFARDSGMPFAHLYAIRKLDAPNGALTMAQLRGGKEAAVYVYDDVLRHSESLDVLHETRSSNPAAKKVLYRTAVSEQLINRDWKTYAVQNFLLSAVDIDLTATDKKDAKYTAIETVVPQNTARRTFRFDLYNDIIADLNDVRNYHVRSVTDGAGNALEFDHRNDEILVATSSSVQPNTAAQLKFEVDGDFLIRPSGDNYWELGVEPWFPQPELGEQYYTFHATTRVKKPFIALSPGTTIRRVEEGDSNVVETKVEQPVQFASILAGKYYFEEDKRDGLTVRVASYGLKNTQAFKKLANLTHQMIDFYEPFLGPFPFTEFNIIEKNEYGYGQAPPATMFITQEAFNPHDDLLSQAFSKGINHRFAHEIAHQYWGHVVKMPSGQEQWLTESFAEYSSALLMNKMKGKSYFNGMVSEWKANASNAADASSIPMANRLAGDPMVAFQQRTFLVYDKGAYLLSKIHKDLGDEQFLTFLKSYQKTFRWKYGATAHVAGMLQFVSKKDYGPFFEENFWGTGMPK